MTRLQKWWSFLTVEATLRSRRSWTRWRQSLTEQREWRRKRRLLRRRARAARRHRLLQELTAEQLTRLQELEQRLYPAMTVVPPEPELPMVHPTMPTPQTDRLLEAMQPLLQEELERLEPLPPAEQQIGQLLGLPQLRS